MDWPEKVRGADMFGKSKKPSAKKIAEAEELGHKVATKMSEMIDRYIDVVVRFAVSGWLQQMAARARDIPYEQPDDFEFIQSKFFILTDFIEQLDDIVRPFEEQIAEFIQRDFAFILEDTKVGFRPPYEDLIAKKFDQEKDRIANSASYVLGLSEAQLRESNLI